MAGGDDQTVAAFQQANLIVVNGASFEKGLAKVTLAESRVVDTAKPLADELIVLTETVTHTHGPQGKHSHEGIDGHT
jgi:zinc transport system substrate-binding protein